MIRIRCPECPRDFANRWINRHLVATHGYKYLDGKTATKVINK